MIVASRTANSYALECLRKRFLGNELGEGDIRGFEARRLALPLATGIYVHEGLAKLIMGESLEEAVHAAVSSYTKEVTSRGLEVEAEATESDVVREQAALIEGLLCAFARVRLPAWLERYDVVEVEREECADLAPDVKLMARTDVIVRRKSDQKLFLVNWKTVGSADKRWYDGWETDSQILTEALAVEQRLGEKLGGVIVEGLVKGRRMPVKDADKNVIGYKQSSPLIYGYKHPGNPPIEMPAYDFAYTRKKGWGSFKVWEEDFNPSMPVGPVSEVNAEVGAPFPPGSTTQSSIAYWVNWLPEELVEAQFAIVPPLLRNAARIESKVRQMVALERKVREGRICVDEAIGFHTDQAGREGLSVELSDDEILSVIDEHFPQNERACNWPSKCPFYDACWIGGVLDDMAGSGLFRKRVPHHPQEVELVKVETSE